MQIEKLEKELEVVRKELKNVRQELHKQKAIHEKDVKNMKSLLMQNPQVCDADKKKCENLEVYEFNPVGRIESCFKEKNGTPRQSNLCPFSRAHLILNKSVVLNPEHTLIGLEEYSYIWILFIFHKNGQKKFEKTKVCPPRLNGSSVGVFSTRSPHRPNAIGLSLTKLEKIEGNILHLSGVDFLDGTPVLDIKPFIPQYDVPNKGLSFKNLHEAGVSKDVSSNDIHTINSIEQNCDKSFMEDESKILHGNAELNSCTQDAAFSTDIKELPTLSEKKSCSLNSEKSSLQFEESERKEYSECDQNIPLYKVVNLNPQFENSEKKECSQCEDSASLHEVVNSSTHNSAGCSKSKKLRNVKISDCSIPSWIAAPIIAPLNVIFTRRAESDLKKFHCHQFHADNITCRFCLQFLLAEETRYAITDILQNDPRSTYRRKMCADRLYYFSLDSMHLTCWFDDHYALVEILRILPCATHKMF